MTPMAMHDDGLDAEETGHTRLWLLQSTSLGLLAGAICVWPRLMPWMLAAVTLLFVLPSLGAARGLGRRTFNGLAAPATLLLPALGILSGIWSVDRAVTLATAVTAFGLAVCALVLIGLSRSQMGELTPAWRRRFVRSIPIGAGIGLGYLLAEVLTGNALTRRILSTVPALVGLRGQGL